MVFGMDRHAGGPIPQRYTRSASQSAFMFGGGNNGFTPRTANSRAVAEILALDSRSGSRAKVQGENFGSFGFNTHLAPRGDHVVRGNGTSQFTHLTPRTAERVSAQRSRFLERYTRQPTDAERSAAIARRQEVYEHARKRWEASQRVAAYNRPQRPDFARGGTGFRATGGGAVHYSHNAPAPVMVNKWMATELQPEYANSASRTSLKSRPGESIRVGDGTTRGKDGAFHISRHFQDGTLPAERFRRGIPPGYGGTVPMRIDHEQTTHKPQGGPAPPVEYTQYI